MGQLQHAQALNSRVDLVFTALQEGDIGGAEAAWPSVWEEVRNGRAWQAWLLAGKMVAAWAEIALHSGRTEEAAEWAGRAIDMARTVRRRKYEVVARTTLGGALLGMRRAPDAVAELRTAVEGADRLASPPARWQTRAALARALSAVGDDDGAGVALGDAAKIIDDVAGGLAPERARGFLSADPIRTVIEGAP